MCCVCEWLYESVSVIDGSQGKFQMSANCFDFFNLRKAKTRIVALIWCKGDKKRGQHVTQTRHPYIVIAQDLSIYTGIHKQQQGFKVVSRI